jgi:hypothetical protein
VRPGRLSWRALDYWFRPGVPAPVESPARAYNRAGQHHDTACGPLPPGTPSPRTAPGRYRPPAGRRPARLPGRTVMGRTVMGRTVMGPTGTGRTLSGRMSSVADIADASDDEPVTEGTGNRAHDRPAADARGRALPSPPPDLPRQLWALRSGRSPRPGLSSRAPSRYILPCCRPVHRP